MKNLENTSLHPKEKKTDHVMPEGRWQFDDAVTDVFEDMLRRSIPQYDVMRRSVFDLGRRFVKPRTHILDLGCSRGDGLAPFVNEFGAQCSFVGIEVSEPMLEACRRRFAGMIRAGVVDVKKLDLRKEYPSVNSSLTLSVLTLMFVPMEHRQKVIRESFKHLIPGGALIVVEKILGTNAELDALMVDEYLSMKREHGYSEDEIQRKKFSLEGVLVPVTARWNEELLRMAGFSVIDCFWRWMNFAGWIAIKDQL